MRNLNRRFVHIVMKYKKKRVLNRIMWLKGNCFNVEEIGAISV